MFNDCNKLFSNRRSSIRSILIVFSFFLLNQWIQIFDRVITNVYRLRVYHDDTKIETWFDFVETKKFFLNYFNKNHSLFDFEIKDNVWTIIFITSQTLIIRHDFNALRKSRKNQNIDATITNLNENWNRALNDCFEMMIIDETHFIKNMQKNINTIINWFKTWILKIIDISIFNEIQNFKKWMYLIQSLKAQE